MKRSDKIGNMILNKYYEAQKNSVIERKVTSVSLGIEDWHQFRAELLENEYFIDVYRHQVRCLCNKNEKFEWRGMKINCCPRKKRLIRVNFRLTDGQRALRKIRISYKKCAENKKIRGFSADNIYIWEYNDPTS